MTDKLVYSAVAIPGEPDYDGEILTEEEIQYAAHKFMSNYRIIDPEHVCALTNECINVGNPVESTILREPMTVKSIHDGNEMTLPKGSWILGIEVTDPKEWERIVTGEATGLSLTAARSTLKSRVLIRDLGRNWEVKTVSIVRDPAVPKAKFFQIGRSGMMNDEATKSRLQEFFTKIEEAVKSFKTEEEDVVVETIEDVEAEAVKSEDAEAEPTVETEEDESIKSEETVVAETEEETIEESETSEEEEVVTEESEEEAVKFVTAEELQSAKEEILEAVKTLMQPCTEDEAVKAEPEPEDDEEEDDDSSEDETTKKDDEDLDEIRRKDIKIQELEKKILDLEAKLESANKSRSKGIPPHFEEKRVVKNLYIDDNRDLYGRVIK